jgi:hypothetical protein
LPPRRMRIGFGTHGGGRPKSYPGLSARKGVRPVMPGETDLHKTLKKEACRWLYKMGYRCIAAEVRLRPLGIIDAVGTGLFRAWHNYICAPYELPQTCFIECKASRSDFLRDLSNDGQMEFCMLERRRNLRTSKRRSRKRRWNALKQSLGLGKFDACIAQPMGNLHYVLAPPGVVQKKELAPRWGLLTFGESGISVTVRATWQDCARTEYVESAIARTLTGDIYRADDRALASINREIFAQQAQLAEKLRSIRPRLLFDPEKVEPQMNTDERR